MPKLAANLTFFFPELDFLDRFDAAASAGFRAVEYQFPYAWDANTVAERAQQAGVEVILHNLPAGDPARDRGIAALPDRKQEFRDGVEQAIEYALAVKCPRLNCLAGVLPVGVSKISYIDTLIDNLLYTSAKLQQSGVLLLLEACNSQTMPGFLVNTSTAAIEILNAANCPNIYLQYDIFHMQIMEGNLAATIEKLLPRIGHIQLADLPGRHEPGTGEINFPWLLSHIDRIGYKGWIGCEYLPIADTRKGLDWAKPYLQNQPGMRPSAVPR